MEIIFLGTGGVTGVPAPLCDCETCKFARRKKGRNIKTRPSIVVKTKGKTMVVDFGPDFRSQLLRENIKKVDLFLLTHMHLDHMASISDLVVGAKLLMTPEPVLEEVKTFRGGKFIKWLKTRNPDLKIKNFEPMKFGGVKIDTVKLSHIKPSIGHDTPCYGYIFEEEGKKIAYLSDFGKIIEDQDKLYGLDLFICDGNLMEPMLGHIGIKGGIELYKKYEPKQMLFTHMSHSLSPHEELEKYVKKFGNIGIAYDGLRIKF